jgi:hypothetical protein
MPLGKATPMIELKLETTLLYDAKSSWRRYHTNSS